MQILPQTPSSPNSSYAIKLDAPALKCEAGVPDRFRKAFDATINSSVLTTNPATSPWFASGSEIIIRDAQTNNQTSGDGPTGFLSHAFFVRTPSKNVSCELYNGTYDLAFNFSSGVQESELKELKFLAPHVFSHTGYDLTNGYNKAAQSMMEVLRSLLTGFIEGDGQIFVEDTNVLATSLAGCPELINQELFQFEPKFFYGGQVEPWMCRTGALETELQDLFANFTVSMLSNPRLAPISPAFVTAVTTRSLVNHYTYDVTVLWITYGVALAVSALLTLLGLVLLARTGKSYEQDMGTTLLATRNPELVGLTEEEMESVRLRFEELDAEDGTRYRAFVPVKEGNGV
jgi:hypothetical protein